MKISKIIFKDYLHFEKKLEIDLTYPKGHEKEGEPLDKVCFLGQSGTGKTTILEIIKFFVCENRNNETYSIDLNNIKEDCIEIFFKLDDKKYSKNPGATEKDFNYNDHSRHPSVTISNLDQYLKELDPYLRTRTPLLLNFPFCIVGPNDLIDETSESQPGEMKFNSAKDEIKEVGINNNKRVWDFQKREIKQIWEIVFDQIDKYIRKYESQEMENFKLICEKPGDVNSIIKKFSEWGELNPNPIEALAANCLNPILINFNLEVEVDIKKYRNEGAKGDRRNIIIKNKTKSEEVKFQYLSTGTKQVMLTSIPLFFLNPQNSIILFDQPETSLYPNIQWLLPKSYIDTAPNNQFFFATHSPIIASSFDPWEIVELKFNDQTGYVQRKEYFDIEQGRHVDNYLINPKLLRWDSSYKTLFHLNRQGNEDRITSLEELAILERKLLAVETDIEKIVLIEEYKKLAKLLDWEITDYAENK